MTKKENVEATCKVMLAGEPGTGKTSLVTRLTKQTFDPAFKNSDLINVNIHKFTINNEYTVTTCIWDLGGVQNNRSMTLSAYDGASAVFLVYDIANSASFEALPDWLKLIRGACHPKKTMLIGNKMDLAKSRAVSTEEAQTFATENGLLFTETSALNGDYIEASFQQMITALLDDSREETPFQVILIDRKAAAKGQLHCIEKPLHDDLQFVALSYRWGELHETLVDTGLGYIASITSFRLQDFYRLCQTMEYDPDLKEMDYVWVDAICVDQANYERRKATVYHMSEIYERADYILAVPDLHLQHLKDASMNTQRIISSSTDHMEYLYYLLHANFEKLYELDYQFLDDIGFPDNYDMREWLTRHTDHLTTGFLRYQIHANMYDSVSALEHLCETILEACQSSRVDIEDTIFWPHDHTSPQMSFDTHYCTKETDCPMDLYWLSSNDNPWEKVKQPKTVHGQESLAYLWSRMIAERSTQIRQGVLHLMSLVNDWSTRAWVISEFNISKKKNNLKYWFLQFPTPTNETLITSESSIAKKEKEKTMLRFSSVPIAIDDSPFRPMHVESFYKFDFKRYINFGRGKPSVEAGQLSEPVCQQFHKLMAKQLRQQSFLEMMLKSKASRNEDRFHAVFPSSPYKHILKNRDVVSSWNIQSLVSVKLKLYELMDTQDQLNLFFLSGHWNSVTPHPVQPTFATSTIHWQGDRVLYPPIFDLQGDSNFASNSFMNGGFNDICDDDVIRLVPLIDNSGRSSKYCLHVEPREYYKLTSPAKSDYLTAECPDYKTVCERLHIDASTTNDIDIICISPRRRTREFGDDYVFYNGVSLIGSFVANKWEIHKLSSRHAGRHDIPTDWQWCERDEHHVGFDIY